MKNKPCWLCFMKQLQLQPESQMKNIKTSEIRYIDRMNDQE